MSDLSATATPAPRFTSTQWIIVIVASIGFAFDTYELLMLAVMGGPALAEVLQVPDTHQSVTEWLGWTLWIAAGCGGIFGLMGGWLVDKFGRKRIMAASIMMYSISPVLAAVSTSLFWFVFFRCTTFIGVCVEFVAAITWLSELFPDKRQKKIVLGVTQAFASVGGLLVTVASMLAVKHAASLPALPVEAPFNPHAPWRYTLITGLLPALPILILLPFVPESHVWQERRKSGTLKRPSFGALFSPELRRATIVTAILSACAYGVAFGAIQLTPTRISPGMPDLAGTQKSLRPLQEENKRLLEAWNKAKSAGPEAADLGAVNAQLKENRAQQKPYGDVIKERSNSIQLWQELGGLSGRIALAVLLLVALGKRTLLWLFQFPALLVIPLTYWMWFQSSTTAFHWGIALTGFFIVAQFSYMGEFLPRVFPLHLRGTGGSFATNVGGRMIGTSMAFVTTNLVAPWIAGGIPKPADLAKAAGYVGLAMMIIGVLCTFFLPKREADEDGSASAAGKPAPKPTAAPAAAYPIS